MSANAAEQDWKARYEAAQEQIKRLREALIYFMSNEFVRDQPLHVMTDKAQAILKETAP